jgi:hypothetical protein
MLLAQVALLLKADFLGNPGRRIGTRARLAFLALVGRLLGRFRFALLIGADVTPHMVTNSFQEQGLLIWEIFILIPIWLQGSPYGNVFYMGIFTRLPIWTQTLFWNGLVTELSPYRNRYPLWCGNPCIDTGIGLFLIPIW